MALPTRSESHSRGWETGRMVRGLGPSQPHPAVNEHEGNPTDWTPNADCDDLKVRPQMVGYGEKGGLGPV